MRVQTAPVKRLVHFTPAPKVVSAAAFLSSCSAQTMLSGSGTTDGVQSCPRVDPKKEYVILAAASLFPTTTNQEMHNDEKVRLLLAD